MEGAISPASHAPPVAPPHVGAAPAVALVAPAGAGVSAGFSGAAAVAAADSRMEDVNALGTREGRSGKSGGGDGGVGSKSRGADETPDGALLGRGEGTGGSDGGGDGSGRGERGGNGAEVHVPGVKMQVRLINIPP